MISDCRLFSVRDVAGVSMLFATLLCARGATAQVSRVAATLEGTVRDSSGAAIAGSSVSVRNTFTSQSRTITSDEQRFFRAEQLAVGPYRVRVEQPGFALYQHTGVVLSLGQTIHLDIVLSPASASSYGQCATLCNGYISSLRSIVGGSGEDRGATRKEPQLSRFRTSGADLCRTIGPLAPQLTVDLGLRYDFERLPAGFNQDTNNASPRVGLAWSPSPKWVLRSGYGIFFDRYVLANITRAIEKGGSRGFEQVADGNVAASLFVTAQGDSLPAPAAGIARSIYRSDSRMATPYSQQASAGTEFLLAKKLTLRADYLFVHGVRLPRTLNVNLLPPLF